MPMNQHMHTVVCRLLRDSPTVAPIRDLDDWWARHQASGAKPDDRPEASGAKPGARPGAKPEASGARPGNASPLHRAMLAGFAMDRLGYAFASGYREALCFAVPDAGAARLVLCATEHGGAHPRAIETRLAPVADADAGANAGQEFVLSGAKEYASLGTFADEFVVIASAGHGPDGRNRLVAVRVPRERAGVIVETMPETPFIPEIPHARLRFEGVRVAPEERLPGDGYERYLKPFRTIEDMHVQAALLGWLVRIARRYAWPHALTERALALLISLSGLLPEEPERAMRAALSPCTHIALAGVLEHIADLLERMDAHWADTDPELRARWSRDRPLLAIAGKARARRREVAWQRLTTVA